MLPNRKIGQLDLQLRQWRTVPRNKRPVERIKLSRKNGQRPHVIYDVVKFHDQPMISPPQPEHKNAPGDRARD